MTIQELIDQLEDMKDLVGENAEVRFASQPSWPFEYSIDGAYSLTKDERRCMAEAAMRDEGMTEDEIKENIDEDELDETEDVVYLEEGYQIGYLPDEAKQLIGW